mgnify:CR=1 FL=1
MKLIFCYKLTIHTSNVGNLSSLSLAWFFFNLIEFGTMWRRSCSCQHHCHSSWTSGNYSHLYVLPWNPCFSRPSRLYYSYFCFKMLQHLVWILQSLFLERSVRLNLVLWWPTQDRSWGLGDFCNLPLHWIRGSRQGPLTIVDGRNSNEIWFSKI